MRRMRIVLWERRRRNDVWLMWEVVIEKLVGGGISVGVVEVEE